MSAQLQSIRVKIEADGSILPVEPLSFSLPANGMMTVLVEEGEELRGKEATREAIEEPLEGLARFKNVRELEKELES